MIETEEKKSSEKDKNSFENVWSRIYEAKKNNSHFNSKGTDFGIPPGYDGAGFGPGSIPPGYGGAGFDPGKGGYGWANLGFLPGMGGSQDGNYMIYGVSSLVGELENLYEITPEEIKASTSGAFKIFGLIKICVDLIMDENHELKSKLNYYELGTTIGKLETYFNKLTHDKRYSCNDGPINPEEEFFVTTLQNLIQKFKMHMLLVLTFTSLNKNK